MIKFGTDGWRGIIADDFTVENVKKVSWAIGKHVLERFGPGAVVLVARDGRFLGERFVKVSSQVLSGMGLEPIVLEGPTATPVCAFAVKHLNAKGAVMFTASHNPPEYQGLKFIPFYAGPATPDITSVIESYIPDAPAKIKVAEGDARTFDPTENYIAHVKSLVQISGNGQVVVTDTLHGVGGRYLPRILRECGFEVVSINEELRPDFAGLSPEPKRETLGNLASEARKLKTLGLSTDGDADRFGIVDENGDFYSANYILTILYNYLLESGRKGGVARTVATTHMLDEIARIAGQPSWETPVGFKYLGQLLLRENVLLAGEESGGASIAGHIPEKDGIMICILVLKAVCDSGHPLRVLLDNIYKKLGARYVSIRMDFKITHEQKEQLISVMDKWNDDTFCGENVLSLRRDDGLKIVCDKGWVLLRPSGTEDVVRLYIEANGDDMLEKLKRCSLQIFGLD